MRRETAGAHYAEARRRQLDAMLVDGNGELLPASTPVADEAASRGGSSLWYRLGPGVTAYVVVLGYAAGGTLLAALLTLPTVAANLQGGVLTSLGYKSAMGSLCATATSTAACQRMPPR